MSSTNVDTGDRPHEARIALYGATGFTGGLIARELKHGEPIVKAAVETGTQYLDTTGEQPFMRMVFDKYGERARAAGVALVSGMGFDYAPGDMSAALTADGMGSLEEIVVATSGVPSRSAPRAGAESPRRQRGAGGIRDAPRHGSRRRRLLTQPPS
jgi:short subunit dehydrogenase-like uncharacterized protein